jgi:hypothetical protein
MTVQKSILPAIAALDERFAAIAGAARLRGRPTACSARVPGWRSAIPSFNRRSSYGFASGGLLGRLRQA